MRIWRIPGVPFLTRIMPRGGVMAVRRFLEAERGKKKEQAADDTPKYTDEQRATVEQLLTEDQAFVTEMFAAHPVYRGGKPFTV